MKSLGTRKFFLKEEGITLRKFELTDAESMFKNYCNDIEVSRHLKWAPHGDIGVTNALLNEWVSQYDSNTYRWAIEYKGEVLGSIDLMNLNFDEEKATIGYVLAKKLCRKDLMTKTLNTIIKYSFEELGLKVLEAIHTIENPASGRVMQKI